MNGNPFHNSCGVKGCRHIFDENLRALEPDVLGQPYFRATAVRGRAPNARDIWKPDVLTTLRWGES